MLGTNNMPWSMVCTVTSIMRNAHSESTRLASLWRRGIVSCAIHGLALFKAAIAHFCWISWWQYMMYWFVWIGRKYHTYYRTSRPTAYLVGKFSSTLHANVNVKHQAGLFNVSSSQSAWGVFVLIPYVFTSFLVSISPIALTFHASAPAHVVFSYTIILTTIWKMEHN